MSSAQDITKTANQLRIDVLEMVRGAGAGHVAGPLSSADIFATLYFGEVVDHSRDKIVLSCGHYCPIQYAALSRKGVIPHDELETFMEIGSRLPGHPERGLTPGVEASTGPLGQGVSVAVGIALGMKIKYAELSQKETPKVFCILSDGELQEGQVWEAFNFAVRRQLDNLIFILDRNGVQIENYISQIATYGEVEGRLESFGLSIYKCDGNLVENIEQALTKAKKNQGGPAIIVADTVAGKGVSFMENNPKWHDRVPSSDELMSAIQELSKWA